MIEVSKVHRERPVTGLRDVNVRGVNYKHIGVRAQANNRFIRTKPPLLKFKLCPY